MKLRPPLLALLAGLIVVGLVAIAVMLILHGSRAKDDQLIMAVISALGAGLTTLGAGLSNLLSHLDRRERDDEEEKP